MTTIIERSTDNSAITALVVLVAVAIIAVLALYVLRVYPFNGAAQEGAPVNIEVNSIVPTPESPGSPNY